MLETQKEIVESSFISENRSACLITQLMNQNEALSSCRFSRTITNSSHYIPATFTTELQFSASAPQSVVTYDCE